MDQVKEIARLSTEVKNLRTRMNSLLGRKGGAVDGPLLLGSNRDVYPDCLGNTFHEDNGLWTRVVNRVGLDNPTEHFDGEDSMPSTFDDWAGSPFGTVNSVEYNYRGSWMNVQPDTGGNGRHFLYQSVTDYLSENAWIGFCLGHSAACGLRIDDGTDDNYCEALWHDDGYVNQFEQRDRTSGGTENVVQFFEQEPGDYMWLRMYVYDASPDKIYWYTPGPAPASYTAIYSSYTFTWTASRVGIIIQEGEGGYGRTYVDWYQTSFS